MRAVHQLLYLIGEPGAGKSTLMGELTAGVQAEQLDRPVPHVAYRRGNTLIGVQLGRLREGTPGTDALAYNALPAVIDWLLTKPASLVLGEGARLANSRFLNTVRHAFDRVDLVHLVLPPDVAEMRRLERGTTQAPAWVKGRRTSAYNLARAHDAIEVLNMGPRSAVLHQLLERSPVAMAFHYAKRLA
jgi:ribose 1,5-bisphosphokinase PhnN